MHPDEGLREEALKWAVLTGTDDFDDWDGFTLWLERDPAHGRAYDEISAAVDQAVELLENRPTGAEVIEAANDDTPAPSWIGRHRWFGPALAASLLALIVTGVVELYGGDDVYVTSPGERQRIALEDGSVIELASGSRLVVEEDGARRARLEQGQALFLIRHDASDPFVLVARDATLVDAGTIFDVKVGRGGLEVAVAEGAVIVNPQDRDLKLVAGERLMLAENDYAVSAVALGEVGEWAQGRITFREAPLSEIAVELTRATGTSFTVAPGSASATLTGSITLDPVNEDPRSLEPILGVNVVRSDEGWMLSAE